MDNRKIKILIVDDDEMMRIFFRDVFWIHGRSNIYDVSIASSLEEAETIINNKETRPDTIFLDVMMNSPCFKSSTNDQIERCFSFIRKIKNSQDLSHIKIIINSGYREKNIEENFRKIGVDDFIIKGDMMPKEIVDYTDKLHERNN